MKRRYLALAVVGALVVTGGALWVTRSPGSVGDPAASASPVEAQLDYLTAHWSERNSSEFGSLGATDCVNFTSQGLLARGWEMDDEWWHFSILGWHRYGRPWTSSTAFRDYLAAHPELGDPIDAADAQVGDVVQFDWDSSGNRDHTATVSRIDENGGIFVIQHSSDRQFEPVTQLVADHADGAGDVFYWHPTD